MSEVEQLDGIIIGTGQSGKPLAGALAEAGWRMAIIEKGRVGGTCVVEGCTPTKTMVASARVAYLAGRAADYGVRTGGVSVDLEAVRKRKRDIVDSWTAGSQKRIERHETMELIFGTARFSDAHEVTVELNDGGSRVLAADNIFINAGTRTSVPPIPGLDSVDYLDSTSIMELAEVPEHLIVLGGGYVGLEFGQMFRRFGAAVTVLERNARLLVREDEDISDSLAEILRGEGIEILMSSTAAGARPGASGGVEVDITTPEGTRTLTGSHLLVAAGRRPNTDLLDPEAAGLDVSERGFITVNDRLETNVPGVWALGDINGGPPFTHISYDDYRVVKDNVLGAGGATRAGRMVPYTLFTDPQLGRVGLTEAEALKQGRSIRVGRLPMSRVARAIEADETRGMMKAIVDAETDQILGAAVLGIEGGEVATVLQMAMMGGVPYTAIRDGVFSHPTLSESLNNLFMAME
jgi:pyruvate/2-oxoglutarate dehydrogenase complex dihydrolipoamide dehydrogenase (E3) component